MSVSSSFHLHEAWGWGALAGGDLLTARRSRVQTRPLSLLRSSTRSRVGVNIIGCTVPCADLVRQRCSFLERTGRHDLRRC